MIIHIVQLWIPRTELRSEKLFHSIEDAKEQHKDFVRFIQKHKLLSARVASVEVVVPDPNKVLDHLQYVEVY